MEWNGMEWNGSPELELALNMGFMLTAVKCTNHLHIQLLTALWLRALTR